MPCKQRQSDRCQAPTRRSIRIAASEKLAPHQKRVQIAVGVPSEIWDPPHWQTKQPRVSIQPRIPEVLAEAPRGHIPHAKRAKIWSRRHNLLNTTTLVINPTLGRTTSNKPTKPMPNNSAFEKTPSSAKYTATCWAWAAIRSRQTKPRITTKPW